MIKEYSEKIFNFTNKDNDIIHSSYTYTDKNKPLVIICPQFEKTVRNNLVPMMYLINAGFNVFRYDNTYHKGNSKGDFVDYTIDNTYHDLVSVIEYIKNEPEIDCNNGVCIIGISISSRIAFRYLSNHPGFIDMFLSIVGAINMQNTIASIVGEDVIQQLLDDRATKFGIKKVLNYPLDWDKFLNDAIDKDYYSKETTKNEITKIETPIYIIAAEHDKWVDINDYFYVFSENSSMLRGMYKIPNSGHELYKNPQAAEYAFFEMVAILNKFFFNEDLDHSQIEKPAITEIIKYNKLERSRENKYEYLCKV